MQNRIIVGLTALAMGAVLLVGQASAAPPQQLKNVVNSKATAVPPASAGMTDQTFVTNAVYANRDLVQMGRMVLRQAISGHLRDLGMKIMNDHTRMNKELITAAHAAGYQIPSGSNPATEMERKHLAKLNGIAFDRAMWAALEKRNSTALSLFRAEAASSRDSQLAVWAKKQVAGMQQRLVAIQKERFGRADNLGATKTKTTKPSGTNGSSAPQK